MPQAFKIIGKSQLRPDALSKAAGEALYVADLDVPGAWLGGVLRATVPAGRLKNIRRDPAFDWSGVTVLTAKDLPGPNAVAMVRDDYEILAEERISYATQALALVAAPDSLTLRKALAHLEAEIEETVPVLTVEDSIRAETVIWGDDNLLDELWVKRGNLEKGFSDADHIVEGTYRTHYQEHVYLENQGMVGRFLADGSVEIDGSLQCPYYVQNALAKALNVDPPKVVVRQATTGGGFGGKEDYPSVLAVWAALLSQTCGHPVKIFYDRTEDLLVSTKRHPSKIRIKSGVKADGTITAMEIDLVLDGGAATTMSKVVLSRSVLHCTGAYKVPNAGLRARAVATNTPPNGAFRGFGAPQSLFALERHMDKMAGVLKMDPLAFRLKNVMRRGDSFPYGQVMNDGVCAAEVLEDAAERSDYKRKYAEYRNQEGRLRKGVGLSLCLHGGGFTGSGEDAMNTRVAVEFTPEGTVEVLASSTDMGQGASTVLPMIAAEALELPFEKVRHPLPDTSRVPNSGPTVASRTTMYVGSVTRDAALDLLKKLKNWMASETGATLSYRDGVFYDGATQAATFDEAARRYLAKEGALRGEALFKPRAGSVWDDEKYEGHAYKGYSWMAQVVEVEVDCDTYAITPLKSTVSAEIGRAVNPIQVQGQFEGGALQSYGWSTIEDLSLTPEGTYHTGHLNGYVIPTTLDTPKFDLRIFEEPCPTGAYGAKGIGELAMDGGAPAMAAAVQNALGVFADRLPLTGEELYRLMKGASS